MKQMWQRLRYQWRDHAIIAALAIASSIAGLCNDFVYDDIPIIRDNLRIHSLANWREILTQPYWPPPFIENLYRPLAVLVLSMEYALGDGSALVFRLVSYALYAACAVGFFVVATRLVSRSAALAAAALFAVHPVHVEAVALGVNQGELLVAGIALLMTGLYVARRESGALSVRDWAVLCGLYAAAGFTKEQGYVLPGMLLAAELFVVRANIMPVRAPGVLTPQALTSQSLARPARTPVQWQGFLALAITGALLLLARNAVLSGRLAGATPYKDFAGLSVGERMYTMLQVVPHWFRLLAWPQRLQVDFAPGAFAMPAQFGLPEAAGVAILVATLGIVVAAWRRLPVVSFGLSWCAIALLPVSNIVPSGIMLAERTLFLPSVGFLLAVAACGERATRVSAWPAERVRSLLQYACVALVVLGVVRSANRHSVWNSAHLRVVNSAPAVSAPTR